MPPKLIAFPGSDDEAELVLDDAPRVSLGRASSCDIVIQRRMASRQHAFIESSGDSCVLVDDESYNGTWLNGRLVERANLTDGDEIRIAGRKLRFVGERAAEANPLEAGEETLEVTPLEREEAAAEAARRSDNTRPLRPLGAEEIAIPSWEEETTEELEVSVADLAAAAAAAEEDTTEELVVSPADLAAAATAAVEEDSAEEREVSPAVVEAATTTALEEDTIEELEVSSDDLEAAASRRDEALPVLDVSPEEVDAALEDLDLLASRRETTAGANAERPHMEDLETPEATSTAREAAEKTAPAGSSPPEQTPAAADPPGELALTSEDAELLQHAQGVGRNPVVPDPTNELDETLVAPESRRKATAPRPAPPATSDHRLLYALALVAVACAVLILWSIL